MRRQAGAAIALAVVWGLAMSGCTPQPAPVPSASATGFASDEEAFAAAEATYRAYVDALNRVDLADPRTFEPVYELTDGEANEKARSEFSFLQAKGLKVGGATRITRLEVSPESAAESVVLLVCADVSQVTLINAAGESEVSTDRPPVQPLSVTVATLSTVPRISSISGREGAPECS